MRPNDDRVAVVTGASGTVATAVIDRLQTDGFRVAGLDDADAAGDLWIAHVPFSPRCWRRPSGSDGSSDRSRPW